MNERNMMSINAVQYHVNVIGNGPNVVVFLHGFTGRGANWVDILPYIQNKESYTFVFPDVLGHGLSEKPMEASRYSMENTIEDLYEIIKNITEKKIHVIGYSMGGRIALSFALKYPFIVKGLLLESASPGLQTESERHMRQLADEKLAIKIEGEGLERFIEFWTNIPLFETQKKLTSEEQRKILQQRLDNDAAGLANSLRGIGTGSQPSYWGVLKSLHLPVTLVAGKDDKKFIEIAKSMNSLFPMSTFIEINRAGHAIHVEQSEKFGKIVSEFLSEEQ
ncbi:MULTISPECIES: 2-succinyl-6-hydroxy-2,4-cyclohexadiene-1-carboxylate synthase [Bacillus]|uniref:2-succinyl-6-hydroxy-2, 4-cyclohexadiene-1-carboxylate synthase n=1 Tax=Bacillus TaxID=1386 RepID=UPI0012FEE78C|nr:MULTISPECIES: 2-succinyl-6-hydroxy-2,4-cyclohexadiene-1-carboxylate synthase [Bacillus]